MVGLIFTAAVVCAQNNPNVPMDYDPDAQRNISITEEGNVSLDFREADIRNVIRVLALKSGINIVMSPEVTGVVTIQLKDVPWKKALEIILQTYGYAYEQEDNIIFVTTIESLKKQREEARLLEEQEPLLTETFSLSFAEVADVIGSVEKMISDRGSININARTNMLIVTDVKDRIAQIDKVVQALDETTPQVLIEAKIVETVLDDDENLGVDWTMKVGVSGSARPHVWPFTTSSDNKYLPDDIPATESGFSYGTLNLSELSAVMELLKNRLDTNILSSPRIVTLDNEKASIDVGVEYPFPQKFFNEDTGTWQLSSWDYKKIGIILEVTPHVNNDQLVTLDIHPKITEIQGLITDSESGSTAPQLSNEETQTRVMIRNNETLVIAGLIKDKVTDRKKKVPFLGDIPLFGLLFQKTTKTVDKTDLIVFITPSIVTPNTSQGPEAQIAYRRELRGAQEAVPDENREETTEVAVVQE